MESINYLLGSADEELNRLWAQHEVWKPEAKALWTRAGFKPGQTILDLGCGPGFASLDLSEWVGPSGKILSFDLSQKFLDHLKATMGSRAIETIQGSVDAITLPTPVDHIYSRWLFCFLSNPQQVLQRLHPLLKTGGRIAICDYFALDYMLYPPSKAYSRVLEAITQSWVNTGGDIQVQQALPGLLEKSGFRIVDLTTISRVARPGDKYWNWPKAFYTIFIPKLVSSALISQSESDAFWQDWSEREKDPSALLKTATFCDIIAEKI